MSAERSERLVAMVNDIANFFAAEPDRDVAIEGVRNHIRRYWEPRMRQKIIAHVREQGGGDLSEIGRAAVGKLAESEATNAAPG